MKIVEIEWIDSTSYGNEWIDRATKHVCFYSMSVGYLESKDVEKVSIVQSYGRDSNVIQNKLVIPRGCIKKIRYLKA